MKHDAFDLLNPASGQPLENPASLARRSCGEMARSLTDDAPRFVPGDALATAINTALCVGEPLLITGEPGTGKTQAAYYAAWKLNLGPVLHFQVKSDSSARDLLYQFDTVAYFHAAHLAKLTSKGDLEVLDKSRFVTKGMLWQSFDGAVTSGVPRVLLIDEIDKAPRDFPNDLLHELDQMEFTVKETGEPVKPEKRFRPVVFITSNSERRLPEPFLRRCVYHHIKFDDHLLRKVLESRKADYTRLSKEFLELAVERFIALRQRGMRKSPSTAELLVWLRVLAAAANVPESQLRERDLSKLPYLAALVKDRRDLEELR